MGAFLCYRDVTMLLHKFKTKTLLSLSALLLSAPLQASSLEEFYKLFKSGQYPKAVEALEKINPEDTQFSKSYLLGLSYSRMQEYDKAITEFQKAIGEKNGSADLYYEYGQALYAANDLKKARTAFKASVSKNFNRPASLYYVAHISQILEEHEEARDTYALVLKEKNADDKMKQIARFQLAEALLSIARDKSKDQEDLTRRVESFIIPMLNTAYNIDKSSALAGEINQRTAQLMVEFQLDPNIMANGRRINPKRYNGYVSQKLKFDDNIALTNEENNVQQSRKESYIFETEGYAKYDFPIKKRVIVSPEARLTYTQHTNQSSAEVYQNDSFVMNFNLKNKYEHKAYEQPASLLFDIDYSHIFKDWQAKKKKEFYAKSFTFTLGESFSYFAIGDTTLKIKRKNYDGKDESISNHTTSLSADQTFFFSTNNLLIALFDASFIDNYNNKSTNTNTYLLRFDYIIPEIMPQYTLALAMATTITDTKEQKATRGSELTFNPSIDLARELSASSRISVNYDFTKNKSDDANYSYSKHVFTTEYRFSF